MKKRDRIEKKRKLIEYRKGCRESQRWNQKHWPAYWKGVPLFKAINWTLKARYKPLTSVLNTENVFLKHLKKHDGFTGEVFYTKIPTTKE